MTLEPLANHTFLKNYFLSSSSLPFSAASFLSLKFKLVLTLLVRKRDVTLIGMVEPSFHWHVEYQDFKAVTHPKYYLLITKPKPQKCGQLTSCDKSAACYSWIFKWNRCIQTWGWWKKKPTSNLQVCELWVIVNYAVLEYVIPKHCIATCYTSNFNFALWISFAYHLPLPSQPSYEQLSSLFSFHFFFQKCTSIFIDTFPAYNICCWLAPAWLSFF